MSQVTAARSGAAHAPPAPGLVGGTSPRDGSERHSRSELTAVERVLGVCTTLRPGEGAGVLVFFTYAYVLLLSYYILKTLREPMLLGTGSAELKSYANATIALVLLLLVPLYSAFFRRTEKRRLVRLITIVSIANLALFCLLGKAGVDVGFVYYVWVGVFGVVMLAQFWAHAACTYQVESGERLFPVVMAGAALGGLSGPPLIQALYAVLGPWNLMIAAMGLLAVTVPLVERSWKAVPRASRNGDDPMDSRNGHLLGGFALVLRQRYLLLLAAMVVLLNCVNALGEYLLTDYVVRNADALIAQRPELDRSTLVAQFYGNYFLAINALSLLFQVLLVARLFRWIGVQGALLVLPAIALAGYALIVFVPVFTLVRAVKILENSTDYSIMNTVRHTLYLPLPTAQKCEGKTAVDTFFWRAGDLLQAGVIYLGLHWFGFEPQHFALVNVLLAALWIVLAVQIGRRYQGSNFSPSDWPI